MATRDLGMGAESVLRAHLRMYRAACEKYRRDCATRAERGWNFMDGFPRAGGYGPADAYRALVAIIREADGVADTTEEAWADITDDSPMFHDESAEPAAGYKGIPEEAIALQGHLIAEIEEVVSAIAVSGETWRVVFDYGRASPLEAHRRALEGATVDLRDFAKKTPADLKAARAHLEAEWAEARDRVDEATVEFAQLERL